MKAHRSRRQQNSVKARAPCLHEIRLLIKAELFGWVALVDAKCRASWVEPDLDAQNADNDKGTFFGASSFIISSLYQTTE